MGGKSQVEPPLDMSEADHYSNTKFVGYVKRLHLSTSLSAQLMAKGFEHLVGTGPRTDVKERSIGLSERAN